MGATTAALTALHYNHQLAIKAESIRDAYALWQSWTPGDEASWRRMMVLAQPVVAARHTMSSAVAARYFAQMAALQTGQHEVAVPAPPLPTEQVEASLVATGLVGVVAARSRGLSLPAAAQVGFVRFQGGLSRLVLLGGRTTLVASVAASSRATGWERVTGDAPCDYCAGLAGEGASDSEVYPAHDNCSCSLSPIWGA